MSGVIFIAIIFAKIAASFLVAVLVPTSLDTVIWTGIATTILYAGFFAVFMFFDRTSDRRDEGIIKRYGLNNKTNPMNWTIITLLGFICIITFILTQSASIQFFTLFGYEPPEIDWEIQTFGQYLLLVFAFAVLPGIIEELLFRGLILHSLIHLFRGQNQKPGPGPIVLAIITSSFLFSIFHMSPAQTVYQFFFGVILACVYLATGNLIYPIVLHFINNFLVVTYTYITQSTGELIHINWQVWVTGITLLLAGTLVICALLKNLKPEATDNPSLKPIDGKTNPRHEALTLTIGIAIALTFWLTAF